MKRLLITGGLVLIILVAGSYLYKEHNEIKRTAEIVKKLKNGKLPEIKFTPRGGLKDGDIVFQESLSNQSRAIQLATHSAYTHCGILYKIDSNYFVFEAVEPVKLTSLTEWMGKGKGGAFKVKRLKNADNILTDAIIKKMKQTGDTFKGKHYDPFLTGQMIGCIVPNLYGRYTKTRQDLKSGNCKGCQILTLQMIS